MKKENMVYGILGIKVRDGVWSAGKDKKQRKAPNGKMLGTSQTLGYCIKEQLERDGFNMLLIGNRNLTFKEAFELKTQKKLEDFQNRFEVREELLKFEDVINFGCVFNPIDYDEIGIRGVNQIGVGTNKYKNSTESNNKIDKALFLHDFTIDPFTYEEYVGGVKEFPSYTEENYQNVKKASIKCVTNSKSKKGCTNDFALFVETKDEIRNSIDLDCLSGYVEVDIEEDGTTVYYLEALADLLNEVKNDLKSVEIYYNHRTSRLIGEIENAKHFNILTRKELV